MHVSRRKFLEQTAKGIAALSAAEFLAACQEKTSILTPEVPPVSLALPAAPRNVRARSLLRSISIIWDAVEQRLDGAPLTASPRYQLWRSDSDGSPFRLIHETAAGITSYSDFTVTPTMRVAYRIIAKDTADRLSELSEPSSRTQAAVRIASSVIPVIGAISFFNYDGNALANPQQALMSVERLSGSTFRALDLLCTHSSCGGMNFSNQIWTCRCHGSQFGQDGSLIQGPAQTPLVQLAAQLDPQGELIISAS
jgi:cytochrome b6-f complex iron-sulfur subunit